MNIRFYATLKDMVGADEIEMAFNGSVGELLERLCDEHGARFKKSILDDSGKLRKYIKLVVNGRNIEHLEGFRTELRDDDTVALFPPIAGGLRRGGCRAGLKPAPTTSVTTALRRGGCRAGLKPAPTNTVKGGRKWIGFTESI